MLAIGKGEAREQHGRKEKEERAHHRLLLRLADGRNQQPMPSVVIRYSPVAR